jgi:cytidylate kinase
MTQKADKKAIVYLSPSTWRELHRIARREGRSVSSILRQLAMERVRAEKGRD